MEIYPFQLPKIDESPEDCEDRLAIASDVHSRSLRAIVADGATSTAFSGQWAGLLAEAYCERPFANWDDVGERAEIASKRWASAILSETRPWHALRRAQSGAAAAFAAIEIAKRTRRWTASTLGDSCVFQLRANRIVDMLPPYSVADFSDTPRLISTNAANNSGLRTEYLMTSGTYKPHDQFVLATDAAAEALLRNREHPQGIAAWLKAMTSSVATARRYVDTLREAEAMRNDDVAVIVIGL